MTEINMFRNARDTVMLQPGEVLFREGETGDVMFAVVEGEVELTLGGAFIENVGPGGIIGEMALVDASPRSATATASGSTRVAAVAQKDFTFLVQEHPTFALQVMTVMAERLRKANEHA